MITASDPNRKLLSLNCFMAPQDDLVAEFEKVSVKIGHDWLTEAYLK